MSVNYESRQERREREAATLAAKMARDVVRAAFKGFAATPSEGSRDD